MMKRKGAERQSGEIERRSTAAPIGNTSFNSLLLLGLPRFYGEHQTQNFALAQQQGEVRVQAQSYTTAALMLLSRSTGASVFEFEK